MNPNHDSELKLPVDLPSPLARSVQSIAEAPLDESAIERVRRRARELATAEPRQLAPRRAASSRGLPAVLAAAVALLVGLGVWRLLPSGLSQSPLHAQVVAATKNVNTIHMVYEIIGADGQAAKAAEMWFARGQGFAFRSEEQIRIDDGRFFWEHVKGSRFASRSRSLGTDALLDQALDIKDELLQCRRSEEGDRKIDRVACRCYLLAMPQAAGGAESEAMVFVSGEFLVRRVEVRAKAGNEWTTRIVRSWEYDLPVPDGEFQPTFPAQVEIVDADEAFGRLTDLPTAVHVEERAGLIFAIHRAVQFENGGVLLMSSVRGTEEILKKFPLERRMLQPGLYVTTPPAANWQASPQGNGYFRITLASANHQGIDVQWWMIVPRGRPAGEFEVVPGRIKVPIGITPAGKYADLHKKEGIIQHLFWERAIDIPHADTTPSLATVAAGVHAEVGLLRAVSFRQLNLGVRDVGGVPTAKLGTVDEIKPADFAAAVAEHVRYWERGDIDFQIKQGGSGDFDPATKQVILIPGAHLSYNSLVDDETLKRVAERDGIRTIGVRHTKITDDGLRHLQGLDELQNLDLAETQISDKGLEHLRTLKSLNRLDVSGTLVTKAGIEKLEAAIPGLEVRSGIER